MQIRSTWLSRVTYLYLLLPFIIFCLGWLRLSIALSIAALMLWALWKLWSPKHGLELADESPDYGVQNREILHSIIPAILLTGLWVFLSGVGGYAFQNWDHHWRNAVLRDLITFDWPVVYSSPERGPIKMLVYYVGYWLPAALTGKLLGWKFANLILFLWTWLGVLLVTLHLGLKLKTSSLKAILLFIVFSGMDALGALIFAGDYPTFWPPVQHLEIWGGNLQYSSFTTQLFWVFNQAVPAWLCISMFVTLSPSTSLRIDSAKGLQFGSRDSSLPKERVAAKKQGVKTLFATNFADEHGFLKPIRENSCNSRLRSCFFRFEQRSSLRCGFTQNDTCGQKTFIWSLCFFFAPLASLGLLPYLLIEWFGHYSKIKTDADLRRKTQINKNESAKSAFISVLKEWIKFLHFGLLLAGAVIVFISYFFFSSNTAAQERGFQALALKDVIVFLLLEGGILWLLLAPRRWSDPRWAVTGILLFIMPFIQFGSGRDFVMRASIAPLFYLMVWTGEAFFTTKTRSHEVTKSFVSSWLGDLVAGDRQNPRWMRITLFVCLCLGALTPLYEINRSIYRTFEYYFILDNSQRALPPAKPATHLEQGVAPEAEHPGSLAADDIQTLAFMDDKLSKNFIANVRQSLYYRFLAPR
ncbi:MAG: hypothetical protein HZB19_02435 [Chloroflexi bacterium]|nr:hypothetical protein [Chloroflexota bacterium]